MQVLALLWALALVCLKESRCAECPSRCDVSACPSPSCPGGYVPDRCNCCLVCAAGEGEPCGDRDDSPCGDGLECRRPDGGLRLLSPLRTFCRCKQSQEVCGSNGKTYANVCQLRAASRKARLQGLQTVSQALAGACHVGAGSLSAFSTTHASSPRYKFNFIADVVEKIAPAVVHIELFLRHPLFGRNIPLSSGSGFVMSQDGLIVTNAHVVSSNSPISARQHLKVQMHNGDVYEATIRDIDKKLDIATIKINPQSELPVLLLGHSADLRPGEFVVAIGSPFALQNTVTTGIVSTAQRDGKELGLRDSDMDYVQTDAIINFGNSGGPLVNLDGEVIGINTLKVAAGISFAIPSDRIIRFLNDSLDKHSKSETSNVPANPRPSPRPSSSDVRPVKKRFIGIRMLTITPALVEELRQQRADFPDVPGGGIYVHEVVPHSPAQKGGIRDGDIIVKLNGRPVVNTAQLQRALQEETALLLEVRRDNDDLLFNIEPDVIMQ
ncbi:serine protease HTRA3 isoform X1 [Corythoichthys intestinalis]|uniref:serine protease HTRA3 isoform X1 n=1 Tax=Corythoichthys intestinalis TaxID=161448 RepID=UPI0025A564E5|nr:serine protease HTRA3 isoform X1 [Corythoichthys intestinalis]